jgi:hypothetical protein
VCLCSEILRPLTKTKQGILSSLTVGLRQPRDPVLLHSEAQDGLFFASLKVLFVSIVTSLRLCAKVALKRYSFLVLAIAHSIEHPQPRSFTEKNSTLTSSVPFSFDSATQALRNDCISCFKQGDGYV